MLDLSVVGACRLLADQIASELDATGVLEGRYSWRVKASQLGGDCLAQQWYGFRWVRKVQIPARIARLFGFGSAREQSFVNALRKAGWTVQDVDPAKANSKFPQWNVKDLHGHLSAYLDAKVSHPVYTDNEVFNGEFKTMNKKNFALLMSKKSIRAVNQEYYGQHCIYCKKTGLRYSVFFVECKDDQEYYVEVVPANDDWADKLLAYGETIATSVVRPSRISESPAFHECKYCDYMNICHYGAPVDVNCRSCVMCQAAEDGKFYCNRWSAIIPNEAAILQACPHHEPVR